MQIQESPLKNLLKFKNILKNYKPSLEILDLLSNNQLVLLAAPTAAGRNVIIKNLIMTGKYFYVVSDTTRKPRINNGIPEKDGREYWFKTEHYFLDGLKQGEYMEAAILHNQQVSGISLREMRKAAESKSIAITDIDINGCDNILNYSDNVIPVFVLPPNFDEWMRRLDNRGVMDAIEKKRRLHSALKEIQESLEKPYFKYIINWDLRFATEELHQHIISGDFGSTEQSIAHAHAKKLITELQKYLKA